MKAWCINIPYYHPLLSSRGIILCNSILWAFCAIIPCFYPINSPYVIIECYLPMLSSRVSSRVIIPCYHPMLSSHVIIPCYHVFDVFHPRISSYVIIPYYNPLPSSFVIIPCFNLMLSPYTVYYHTVQCNHLILWVWPHFNIWCYHLISYYSSMLSSYVTILSYHLMVSS
jgi:hypothetical protein